MAGGESQNEEQSTNAPNCFASFAREERHLTLFHVHKHIYKVRQKEAENRGFSSSTDPVDG